MSHVAASAGILLHSGAFASAGQGPGGNGHSDGRLHEQDDDGEDEEASETASLNGHFCVPVPGIHYLLRLQEGCQRF